jgi:hypothetical protein
MNISLQYWIDFLQNQIVAFDAAYLTRMGEPHVANAELVAFLIVNEAMGREKIEQAVVAFSDSSAWPLSLTGDQLVNLTHRANSAKGLLQAMLNEQLPPNAAKALRAAFPKNQSKTIRWLFVELWKLGGSAYLEALTNSYLAEHR